MTQSAGAGGPTVLTDGTTTLTVSAAAPLVVELNTGVIDVHIDSIVPATATPSPPAG
jgi:hypothetical protein